MIELSQGEKKQAKEFQQQKISEIKEVLKSGQELSRGQSMFLYALKKKILNKDIEGISKKDYDEFVKSFSKEEAEKLFSKLCQEDTPEQILSDIQEKIKIVDLNEYLNIQNKWLHNEDIEATEVVLAELCGELIEGEPSWLFLIAPAGGTKTERLRSFQGEDFFQLSNMTSRTLISGLMIGKNEKRRKIQDLLPQLDKKVLIFKDFTTILEKSKEERNEIIAQLRECYDGVYSAKFGSMDEAVRHNSHFGLVAGVTPVIDKYWSIMQQLGERFIKIRSNEDINRVTKKSRQNEGKEKQMRLELQQASEKFISYVKERAKTPIEFNDSKWGDIVQEIATFLAYCRTPVSIQDYRTDFYFDYIPTPERPTRLVKQFKKLAKLLALIRGKTEVTEAEIKTILRVARDTCPQDRIAVLDTINETIKQGNSISGQLLSGCPRPDIYHKVKLPETSIKRIIQQLKLLGLVEETVVKEGYEQNYHYTLNEKSAIVYRGDLHCDRSINLGGVQRVSFIQDIPSFALPNGSASDPYKSGTTATFEPIVTKALVNGGYAVAK